MATILIVEDEPGIRDLLTMILEHEGHRVVGAGTLSLAQAALAHHPIDLVICDVQLPEGSGLDLVRELARDLPDVAVFMLTANSDPTTAAEALALGATAYVVKPFSHNEVLINVANSLRLRELERAHLALREEVAVKVVHQAGAIRAAIRDIGRVDPSGAGQEAMADALERLVAGLRHPGDDIARRQRLHGYARAVGELAGWPDDLDELGLACTLHDVGTIGVSADLLQPGGQRDAADRAAYERYPLLGHRLLLEDASPVARLAATIALTHAERWDGTGYPRNLADEAIPEAGRIAALAVALEAATVGVADDELAAAVTGLAVESGAALDPALAADLDALVEPVRAVRRAHPPAPPPTVARILLVDDQVMFTDSVARILTAEPDFVLVGAATTAAEAIDASRRDHPDVVLMSWDLAGGGADDATRQILVHQPGARIVLLTTRQDDAVLLDGIRAGCSAFVSKREAASELVRAIRDALRGEASLPSNRLASLVGRLTPKLNQSHRTTLTDRELEVVSLLARGLEVDAIASRLVLSIHTVRNHVRNAMVKLDAHSRLELVTVAVRQGLVQFE